MTKPPILWGAALACALGGAIAGNAVRSIPVSDRSTVAMLYQSHPNASATRDARVPPNHYPLVTRDGVVEVEQLSERGLFSQSRYRAIYGGVSDVADHDPGLNFAAYDAPTVEPVSTEAEAEAPVDPLPLAYGPSEISGQAKIIDVQATLAMR